MSVSYKDLVAWQQAMDGFRFSVFGLRGEAVREKRETINEEMNMSASYKDLVAWQQGMELTELIYELSSKWPKSELYGLVSQVRRAAVSVVSNIAEGQGRNSGGEFLQFLGNAKGSLLETETQILVAERLKYLTADETDKVVDKIDRVSRLLFGLMQSLKVSPGPKTQNSKPKTQHEKPDWQTS